LGPTPRPDAKGLVEFGPRQWRPGRLEEQAAEIAEGPTRAPSADKIVSLTKIYCK
jgi:hypothetical protein